MTKRTIIAPESKTKRIDIEDTEQSEADNYPRVQQQLNPHRRALQKYEQKQQLTIPIEQLVVDTRGMVGNVKWPGADSAFPNPVDVMQRFCLKYYPYAQGGALYADFPMTEGQIARAYVKHDVMKELGFRHVVVEKDSTLEHLLDQLGEE